MVFIVLNVVVFVICVFFYVYWCFVDENVD